MTLVFVFLLRVDVRDKNRLHWALAGVEYVVHAAATKIVTSAETNPFECIKTNINGAINLIDASIRSRSKACSCTFNR